MMDVWQRLSGQEVIPPASADDTAVPLDSLPMFDRDLVVGRRDLGRRKEPRPIDGYGFAAGFNAVPLCIWEFMPAIRHYPIVFVDMPQPQPVALVGLIDDDNLFLDVEGRWQPGAYVPACLRRYPFIAVDPADDEAAGKDFNDLMSSADAFEADCERSECFAADISDQGLLVPRHANIELPDRRKYRLDGFRTVDPAKFRGLPAEVMQEWHRKGWIDPITLHISSMRNWEILRDLHARKFQEEAT